MRRWLVGAATLGVMLGIATTCFAQDDSAAAQVLWDEAKALAQEGRFEGACPKFAESQRLDPQLGTLLNLADCYSRVGKIASAWAKFVEATEIAASRSDPRQEEARKRAAELEPRLTRMRIQVASPVDGLKVTRNGEPVREALFGSSVPVDPGEATIAAQAPGYRSWQTRVRVGREGEVVDVEIPMLEQGEDESSGDEASLGVSGSALSVVGGIVLATGVVGLGVGTALAVVAKGKDDESLAFCPEDPLHCTQQGVDLRDDAHDVQTGAIVSFVAGGLLTVTGALLLIVGAAMTEPADEQSHEIALIPMVGPGGGGVSFVARW